MGTSQRSVWIVLIGLALALSVVRSIEPPGYAAPLNELPERAPPDDSADAMRPPESIEALREAVAAVLERERVPGVGLALIDRGGVVWAGGVGVADLGTGTAVTDETVFRVASITKSFVGLGVARLAGQGRLDLLAPLALPNVAIDNRWHDRSPITLAHALEHTAGFDDMRFNEYYTDLEAMTPADALAINPRSRRARWRAGTRAAYSNVGYSVAAFAIEHAAGEPFDTYLQREVLRPLGITEAAFERTPQIRKRLATGYSRPETVAPFRPIAHRGAGALLASSRDLGKLVHFWLVRGRGYPEITTPALLDRIERGNTLEVRAGDNNYGLGNYGDVFHAAVGRGHNGGLPGFASNYRYFSDLGVGYVVLLNARHSARAASAIRRLMFAYATRGVTLPKPPRAEEDGRVHAGYYAFVSPRHALMGFLQEAQVGWDVVATDAGLQWTARMGRTVELIPTGDGGYRQGTQGGSSLRFGTNSEGARVFVSGLSHGETCSRAAATVRITMLAAAAILLEIAPLWALGWLLVALLRRRGFRGGALVLWPALASIAHRMWPILFANAGARQVLGELNAWTLAVCATTLVFALTSAASMAAAIAAANRRDRAPWIARLVPSLTAVSAFGITIWFGAHGLIGLRTWAW